MNEPITTTQIIIHGGLALFGAVTHALNAHRRGESKTFLDFIALTLMSSFSGVMFAVVALHFFQGQAYISMAIAGTGGFLGVEGMGLIVEKLKRAINSK